MKASEFISEYERRTDNSRDIFAKLQKAGYKMLGGGVDATVWAKDEGQVIKILMPSDDREQADSVFLFFYEICKDNTQNPHLPRFIDIGGKHHTVFELNGVPYRQIAMERLQPIKNGSIQEAMVWGLSELSQVAFIKWHDVVNELEKPDFWSGYGGGLEPEDIIAVLNDSYAMEEYHNLFATMQDLYNEGRTAGYNWDLHTENVMQRKDGTLVITDPYLG